MLLIDSSQYVGLLISMVPGYGLEELTVLWREYLVKTIFSESPSTFLHSFEILADRLMIQNVPFVNEPLSRDENETQRKCW